MMVAIGESSRPEAVFVLLLLQSIFWMVAGLSALPFGLAGELHMAALGLISLVLALGVCLVGIGVVWRRRWARRTALALEVVTLIGSVLLFAVPIGANHGPVALMTNIALPLTVVWLLWGKQTRSIFS
ncbi:MAG TPA: hypothetical protein VGA41_10025 [Candidatus Dormibacteraeota bacterium]